MQHVLIDACGWVACMEAGLNVERDLEALLGPCSWVLLPHVENGTRDARTRASKEEIPAPEPVAVPSQPVGRATSGHTDDVLLACAMEHNWATLTVDTALKRRLYEANLPVIEVRQNNHLHLVDSL